MKLTKEQAIREHRKMWHWIAGETERRQEKVYKEEYFNTFFPAEDIKNGCFCCEYDSQFRGCCVHCPLEWEPNEENMCCEYFYYSLYLLWACINEYHEAAALARQIAELPEREV